MKRIEKDIVIIGAGLTGLTTAFYLKKQGRNVLILEQQDRAGGQIHTFREQGFIYESGPNTGAVSHPEVAELFQLLEPDCEIEIAREEAKRRLIWKGDCFHELPNSLLGGLTTPLFSFYDKFRILGEPFRKKGTDPDEPVGELARRRLGKSYLDYAVDPFISGVYAGDPMQLATRFALPKLYTLEQQYGGFIKGAVAKAREPKTERDRLATKKVFSVKNGLGNLTAALAKHIGEERILLSVKDIRIQPGPEGWKTVCSLPSGQLDILSRQVITTTGGYSLPALLPFISTEEWQPVTNLQYAPVVQVSVGIKDMEDLSFNAFGGLIPSCEKKDVLGILFPAVCFSGRAPEGGALFSFFLGGVRHPEFLSLTDPEIMDLVRRECVSLLKFPQVKDPDLIRIFRHFRAIPQYKKDSGERLEKIRQLENQYPGLILAGNIRDGIGMADRIRQATIISQTLCK